MLSVECTGEVEGESSVSVSACRPLISRRERAGPPFRRLPRLYVVCVDLLSVPRPRILLPGTIGISSAPSSPSPPMPL
jgi:hypothetical protein